MKNVEDIYPVSPMQEFMLLHTLSRARRDTLFNQFCYTIDRDIDVTFFEAAWQKTVARHAALRTAFVWQDVPRPLQVVRENAPVDFTVFDWRDSPSGAQKRLLEKLLTDDRRNGIDPRRAPLMRFTLCRRGDASWYFIWSNHHLILDRWCLQIVIDDVGRFYSSLSDGVEVDAGTAPSFREYIDWIRQQDEISCDDYWREKLRGFEQPTVLASGGADRNDEAAAADTASATIDGRHFDRLIAYVRHHGLTMSTVVYGAWALILNRLCRSQDVVFGATVAGRPPGLPRVDEIVGSFINNVPVRVLMPEDSTVVEWLKGIHADQYRRAAYEYVSPARIHALSDIEDGEPLFDHLLVWLTGGDTSPSLPLRPVSAEFGTAFPMTLSVSESPNRLALHVNQRRGGSNSAESLLMQWRSSIERLSTSAPEAALGELTGFHCDPGFAECIGTAAERIEIHEPRACTNQAPQDTFHAIEHHDAGMIRDLLFAEWRQILGSTPVDADTDFFEAGGDSLQASQLRTRIEQATRQDVPMLALFRRPTIAGMLETLTAQDWPLKTGTSAGIRAKGHGVPLFCIASPDVNTIGYALLARHLPAGQRVYLLQAPPEAVSDHGLLPSELPALADHYLAEMRKIQPAGPYRLLSMCAGSHIALEMTRRLEAQRLGVDFLGIINTWALYTVSRRYYLHRFLNILRYYAGRLSEFSPIRSPARSSSLASTGAQRSATQVAVPEQVNEGASSPWIRDVGFEHCDPMLPKTSATVTVFRNDSTQPFRIRDDGLGWSKQASRVDVVRLAGDDHESIMREPHVRALADAVAKRLEQVSADGVKAA